MLGLATISVYDIHNLKKAKFDSCNCAFIGGGKYINVEMQIEFFETIKAWMEVQDKTKK